MTSIFDANEVELKEYMREARADQLTNDEIIEYLKETYKVSQATVYRWLKKLGHDVLHTHDLDRKEIAEFKARTNASLNTAIAAIKARNQPEVLIEYLEKAVKVKQALRRL
tara:strand:- start:751 stop:1083 length:333 start_codon:yes stop_codon:yes gene_type:complete